MLKFEDLMKTLDGDIRVEIYSHVLLGVCMCLEYMLVELQKKINIIEDKDSNYRKNKKWIKYRSQQDLIYKKIREENNMEL